jgi:hypothetical protein
MAGFLRRHKWHAVGVPRRIEGLLFCRPLKGHREVLSSPTSPSWPRSFWTGIGSLGRDRSLTKINQCIPPAISARLGQFERKLTVS